MVIVCSFNTTNFASASFVVPAFLSILLSWRIITDNTPIEDVDFIMYWCCPDILPQLALTDVYFPLLFL
jgi:hypothetical protein